MLPDKIKPAQPRGAVPAFSDLDRWRLKSVDEAGAGRLRQRRGKRAVLGAVGARELGDLVQVIFRLFAVALFELPQAVVLPGPHVVGVGSERALIPDLRKLVVAELAIGIADQVGDVGAIVLSQRFQLIDSGGVIVLVVDRGVSGVVAGQEFRVVDARALVALLLALGVACRR